MPYGSRSALVWVTVLCWILVNPGRLAGGQEQSSSSGQGASFKELESAYRQVVQRVNSKYGIDYGALDQTYGQRYREYRQRAAIISIGRDGKGKQKEANALQGFFTSPEALLYLEARLFLENEVARDHQIRGRFLQACEGVLEDLITSDPLLRYFFRSPDYHRRFGLLLTRVALDFPPGHSATTQPLDTYTFFADRTRMPVVILISPWLVHSLPYLRSTLIHELNHVLLDKEPEFAQVQRIPSKHRRGLPHRALSDSYTRSFHARWGGSVDHQYHLLHEYYSLLAQLIYDDSWPKDSSHRLPESQRQSIERLRNWAYLQLDEPHRVFLVKHPDPPIALYIADYLGGKESETP